MSAAVLGVQERMFPIFPWFPPDDVDIDAANWVRVLARLGAEEPRIVVPGHGIQAGPEIIRTVRDYMIDLGQRVRSATTRARTSRRSLRRWAPRSEADAPTEVSRNG